MPTLQHHPTLRHPTLRHPSLTRHYAEPVEVEHRDGEPTQFRWRGRRYVVRAVLDHWVATGAWWDDPAARLDDDECEFWRLEAANGRTGPPIVVDLCCAASTAGWSVQQLFD
jgi:hypothetical protein